MTSILPRFCFALGAVLPAAGLQAAFGAVAPGTINLSSQMFVDPSISAHTQGPGSISEPLLSSAASRHVARAANADIGLSNSATFGPPALNMLASDEAQAASEVRLDLSPLARSLGADVAEDAGIGLDVRMAPRDEGAGFVDARVDLRDQVLTDDRLTTTGLETRELDADRLSVFAEDRSATRFAFAYSFPGEGQEPGQLDVDVQPAAKLVMGRDVSGAGAGAMVRIGQNFTRPRASGELTGWYVYAGADAQALTYRINADAAPFTEAMRVEDKVMVGDAQLGVAWRRDRGEYTLGFMHREVKYQGPMRESYSTEESFLGLGYALTR